MKQSTQTSDNPQVDRAIKTLQELAPMVTTEDKKSAPFSQRTVEYYLSGFVRDIDTAVILIKYFRKRIKERDRILASA